MIFDIFEFTKPAIFVDRAIIFEVSAFSLRASSSESFRGISGGFGVFLGFFLGFLAGLLGSLGVSWGALRGFWGVLGELWGPPASPKAGYKRPSGPR